MSSSCGSFIRCICLCLIGRATPADQHWMRDRLLLQLLRSAFQHVKADSVQNWLACKETPQIHAGWANHYSVRVLMEGRPHWSLTEVVIGFVLRHYDQPKLLENTNVFCYLVVETFRIRIQLQDWESTREFHSKTRYYKGDCEQRSDTARGYCIHLVHRKSDRRFRLAQQRHHHLAYRMFALKANKDGKSWTDITTFVSVLEAEHWYRLSLLPHYVNPAWILTITMGKPRAATALSLFYGNKLRYLYVFAYNSSTGNARPACAISFDKHTYGNNPYFQCSEGDTELFLFLQFENDPQLLTLEEAQYKAQELYNK